MSQNSRNYTNSKNAVKSEFMRVPPQSLDSEMALLGSILLKPDTVNDIIETITPEKFYSDRHKKIYEVMLELFSKTTPIDLISLSSRLKEKKLLEQVGGKSYLSELVETVPSAANIAHYADIVKKKYILRNLINASEDISRLGYEEANDIEEILDTAERKIFAITDHQESKSFIELKDTINEAWERLDKLHKTKGEMRGVPTGFKGLDNKLAGFQKSDLIILAARPSVGKTTLALDIARNTAIQHKTSGNE